MSHDAKNGQLQPKKVALSLTAEQMTAIVLLERRIAEMNVDGQLLGKLGCAPLSAAVEQATIVMSKAHDEFIVELQRAVKIAAPGEVPKLVMG